jgi:tetratricopeptide (TPR) repeat protein
MQYLAEERYDEAEGLCSEALSAKPDYFLARNSLGMIRFARGDYVGAENDFVAAASRSPNDVGFQSNIAMSQLEQGKVEAAEFTLQKAARLVDPKDPPREFVSALRNLASSFAEREDFARASANYIRVVMIAPNDFVARLGAGEALYRVGKLDEAAAQISLVLQYFPKDVKALNQYGLIQYAKGNKSEAVEWFENALNIDPEFAEAKINLEKAREEK